MHTHTHTHTQVEMVLRLPQTYVEWCAEVHNRNVFFSQLLTQAEAVSAWVQAAVEKEEERRLDFLERLQKRLPQSLLELLGDRPPARGGHVCGHGLVRAPRMEVQVSARAKHLP